MKEWLKEIKEDKWWLAIVVGLTLYIEPLRAYSYLFIVSIISYHFLKYYFPPPKVKTLDKDGYKNFYQIQRNLDLVRDHLVRDGAKSYEKELLVRTNKFGYQVDQLENLYARLKAKLHSQPLKQRVEISEDWYTYTSTALNYSEELKMNSQGIYSMDFYPDKSDKDYDKKLEKLNEQERQQSDLVLLAQEVEQKFKKLVR